MDPILKKSLILLGFGCVSLLVGVLIDTPMLVVEIVRDVIRGRA